MRDWEWRLLLSLQEATLLRFFNNFKISLVFNQLNPLTVTLRKNICTFVTVPKSILFSLSIKNLVAYLLEISYPPRMGHFTVMHHTLFSCYRSNETLFPSHHNYAWGGPSDRCIDFVDGWPSEKVVCFRRRQFYMWSYGSPEATGLADDVTVGDRD